MINNSRRHLTIENFTSKSISTEMTTLAADQVVLISLSSKKSGLLRGSPASGQRNCRVSLSGCRDSSFLSNCQLGAETPSEASEQSHRVSETQYRPTRPEKSPSPTYSCESFRSVFSRISRKWKSAVYIESPTTIIPRHGWDSNSYSAWCETRRSLSAMFSFSLT